MSIQTTVTEEMGERFIRTKITGRMEWLDALRAVAVLFIIFGHLYTKSNAYFVFTSPIKVPLLFAISGYLFNPKNGDCYVFLKNLMLKLVVPWVVLTWFPLIAASIVGINDRSIIDVLYIVLSGIYMWYFPCLIFAEIIFFFVVKYCKRLGFIVVGSIGLGAVGYILSTHNILSFGMINRALVVQVFFAIGYILRWMKIQIKFEHSVFILAGYIILCIVSLFLFPEECMDVHANRYYNLPLCFSLILLGCVGVIASAEQMIIVPRLLVFLGQNTLILWTMNGYCLYALDIVLRTLHISLPDTLLVSIIKVIYVCITCSIIAILVNWFIPEIVGKRRNKRKRMNDEFKLRQ